MGCTACELSWPYLFSTIDRGMEFMFCRMGTRRSTMAAARGLSSSGFSFTAISPAQEMITHHGLQVDDGIAGPWHKSEMHRNLAVAPACTSRQAREASNAAYNISIALSSCQEGACSIT